MRILYVINPKAEVSQWGRLGDTALTQYLLKGLSDYTDVEVDLVCGRPIGTEDITPYLDKVSELGLHNIFCSFEYDPSKHLSQKAYWSHISELCELYHYDLVHVHQAQVAASKHIADFSSKTNIPVVWTLHNPPEGRATFSYAEDYQRVIDSPICRLVCVSSSAKNRLIKSMKLHNGEDIRYIYNGIPIDPNYRQGALDAKYIGVGRIDPPKNTLGLLQFMEYMYLNHGHKSIYIGSTFSTYESDSSYVSQCIDILTRGVIQGWMTWIKEASHDLVLRMMSTASYYVNLSRVETFSLTSCEAMSVGTPVICFNEAGPGEIVKSEYGIKIPVLFRRSFSSYIKDIESKVLSDHYTYDVGSMHNYVVRNFSIQRMAENYINLYKELIV